MMIHLLRKSSEVPYSPRMKATVLAAMVETLAAAVRVDRPSLVEFLAPTPKGRSEFARLPAVTSGELANVQRFAAGDDSADEKAAKATLKAKSFRVPADSLGRGKGTAAEKATASQAQSILLWIKTRLVAAAVEHGVTVADADGTDLSVVHIG